MVRLNINPELDESETHRPFVLLYQYIIDVVSQRSATICTMVYHHYGVVSR